VNKPEQKPEKTVNRLHAELRAQQRILTILAEFQPKAQARIVGGVTNILADDYPLPLRENNIKDGTADKEF
jgi:hypothetical protein